MNTSASGRLDRLLGYLEADPANVPLLTDAIEAAIAAGELEQAETLNTRLGALLGGSFAPRYFAGLIAMRRGDFASASDRFSALLAEHDQANVRFNLAWSRAMLGDKGEALALLDADATRTFAGAAMLKVQLLHEAGRFDEALALGREMLSLHPDDAGLLSAMATLALDVEDIDLARQCALAGGDHPEALAAAALLDLQDGDAAAARDRFDRSLAAREHNPRAWIGRGLAALVEQDAAGAARDIDRGAQQFGDHIGSWIAAGWAHLLAGDLTAAAQRFERALAIDPAFAESHGSLAVIAAMQGDRNAARRGVTTALRLDRECFSAALAQALLSGPATDQAREIVERAMTTPLNERGLTITAYMTGLAKPTIH